MSDRPFSQVLAVDSDLSQTFLEYTIGLWYATFETAPSILWVHPTELALADRLLDQLPAGTGKIKSLPAPEYEPGWWSVGTRRDKGFGSNGA